MIRIQSSSQRPLRVAISSSSCPRVDALVELLSARKHEVTRLPRLEELDRPLHAAIDVLVVDLAHENGVRGLLLLESLPFDLVQVPVVLVGTGNDPDHLMRAMELGITDVVPEAFAPRSFVTAVESAAGPEPLVPVTSAADLGPTLEASYPNDLGVACTGTRDLVAFLVRTGVCMPHVVRIAAAAAAVLEETTALPQESIELHAGLEGRFAWVRVTGFAITPTNSVSEKRRFLVHRLADQVSSRIESHGLSVELDFELSPVPHTGTTPPPAESLQPQRLLELVENTRSEKSVLAPAAFQHALGRLTASEPTVPIAFEG